ncbi:hypothetical protein IJH19_01835 [Candidatus Saccharibacteria bacterium]|nr:hypothetical protein [Candidatus Saccharibacteria bacterium]
MEIDEKFLAEVGMADMPEEQKAQFLRRTKAELELRVGEEISKGLTPEQIKEFEALSNGDQEAIKKMVFSMESDFRNDKIYQAILKDSGKEQGDWDVLGQYLMVLWIKQNRPNYKEITERVFEKLKEDIKRERN